jgi:hypothetical protein
VGNGIVIIRAAALAMVLTIGIGGCGATCACVAPPSSPVDGIVISVNSTSLTEVHDFTLRTADASGGFTLTFQLGPLENATQFSPGHLKEHQATGSPVRVFFTRSSTGQLIVYRLEDAPPTST